MSEIWIVSLFSVDLRRGKTGGMDSVRFSLQAFALIVFLSSVVYGIYGLFRLVVLVLE